MAENASLLAENVIQIVGQVVILKSLFNTVYGSPT